MIKPAPGDPPPLNEHLLRSYQHARDIVENWRIDYNLNRPHTSLDGLTPYEFATQSNKDHTRVAFQCFTLREFSLILSEAYVFERESSRCRPCRRCLKTLVAEAVLQFMLLLIFATMFFDPLRWIVAFAVVAVARNSEHAAKMSFIRMVCAAVFVATIVEINLQMTPETREFTVPAYSVSVAVSLLIIWLINLALTWLFRNTSSK